MMEAEQEPVVLIAEDDPKTANLIANYLEKESMACVIATDGRLALTLFAQHQPRLVILDVMLPKLSGFDVCTTIRRASSVPIVFLTARADEIDKVVGLGIGGDDYIAKPFSPRELVARIKAHLRRATMTIADTVSVPVQPGKSILSHGSLKLDIEKRRFTLNDEPLSLTPIEYTLLKALIEGAGRVYLRNELLDKIYPDGELVIDRVVDVHVGKLRQKLGDNPADPTYIHTVRGIGYRFADPHK